MLSMAYLFYSSKFLNGNNIFFLEYSRKIYRFYLNLLTGDSNGISVVVFCFFLEAFSRKSAASSLVMISSGNVNNEDDDGNDS